MIVLDASAAVEMARQTEKGRALIQLLFANEEAVSCELMRAEAASVFRKLTRTEGINAQQAEAFLDKATQLVDEFASIAELQDEALRESIRLDHSTYDMFYFVLARRTGGTLVTTDKKLMALCMDHGVNCVAELDWSAEGADILP